MSSDSGASTTPTAGKNNHRVKKEPEQLPCPRCNSMNTKFCYYNNYNFSQPRHFCKSCRRYWTHGGTLRDIPVGGATRKNAKRARLSTAPVSSNNGLLIPFAGDYSGYGGGGGGGGFSSLLSAAQNYQLHHGFFGFDQDWSFGVGRTFWPFTGGLAAVSGGSGMTLQTESGGDGGGDCFVLPELGISTPGNAMKSSTNN